ncbi:MAG TPA: hypothetical protein VHC95_05955 [Opitutales bacterium]|nr:hypothetical protein [Opitutales bacterium]
MALPDFFKLPNQRHWAGVVLVTLNFAFWFERLTTALVYSLLSRNPVQYVYGSFAANLVVAIFGLYASCKLLARAYFYATDRDDTSLKRSARFFLFISGYAIVTVYFLLRVLIVAIG